jgi:hypothetical protein
MKTIRKFFLSISLVVLLFALVPSENRSVQALSTWQPPEKIPGLVDSSPGQYPYFIADPAGKVHVFHSQWVDQTTYSIFYSQWSVGVGWSEPVDIIMPSVGQARVCGAFLDNTGTMNLIFWGGNEFGAMYFTHAPGSLAGKTTAWSEPVSIGPNAMAPTNAAMVSDGNGSIVVVYSGNQLGNGLYSVVSRDNGATWTTARPLYLASSDTLWPSALQLYMTSDQHVHVLWALGDVTGNSRSISYARLDSLDGEWTAPKVLAEAIGSVADTPSMVEYDGSLILIYHNGFPLTRWMIRSGDNGQSWSAPTRLFEQVGSNGAAALVIDSSHRLHMIFGNRVGSPEIHGLWHSIWLEDSWSVPEPIVSGPQIMGGSTGIEGFDPSFAQAVISRGDLLLVIWRHDPMAAPTHIWYSYITLDSPELPVKLLPGLSAVPTPTPGVMHSPSATPTVILTKFPDEPGGSTSTSPNVIMLAGVAPAFLFLIVIVLLKRKQN